LIDITNRGMEREIEREEKERIRESLLVGLKHFIISTSWFVIEYDFVFIIIIFNKQILSFNHFEFRLSLCIKIIMPTLNAS